MWHFLKCLEFSYSANFSFTLLIKSSWTYCFTFSFFLIPHWNHSHHRFSWEFQEISVPFNTALLNTNLTWTSSIHLCLMVALLLFQVIFTVLPFPYIFVIEHFHSPGVYSNRSWQNLEWHKDSNVQGHTITITYISDQLNHKCSGIHNLLPFHALNQFKIDALSSMLFISSLRF